MADSLDMSIAMSKIYGFITRAVFMKIYIECFWMGVSLSLL